MRISGQPNSCFSARAVLGSGSFSFSAAARRASTSARILSLTVFRMSCPPRLRLSSSSFLIRPASSVDRNDEASLSTGCSFGSLASSPTTRGNGMTIGACPLGAPGAAEAAGCPPAARLPSGGAGGAGLGVNSNESMKFAVSPSAATSRPTSIGSGPSPSVRAPPRVSGNGIDSSMSIRRLRLAVTTPMRLLISPAMRDDSASTVRRRARAEDS